ncbi:TVP38/TMEM64 family protein [Ammoniphilus sp. CFH 90114]|uniref:TVP38/TMEM64 family protein n=1 Tax=Ammoniphilus sp. CFH 90114 TaxID=2493665 RepID=UPI00100FA981|nr:TVP38/TMEM64 family protein [Ammoniphilus sp. CFH 90114]RXT08157.1 TVP38/TMEM64 family protein [Ammoniphilus sp. CFH 90114]
MKKRWIIVLFILIAAFILTFLGPIREKLSAMDIHLIAEWLRGLGVWAVLLGSALIIIQTFLPVIPFLVLVAANVLVFGLVGGFLINWISAVVASVLMFYVARTTGRDWAQRKLEHHPKLMKMDDFVKRNGFRSILTLRLFPVIPPVALNLASGVSKLEGRAYILATSIGKIPAILVQSMIGNDIIYFSENKGRILLLVLGFGFILVVGMSLVRKKLKLS